MATLTPDDEEDVRSLQTDDDTSLDTYQRDVRYGYDNQEGSSDSTNNNRTFRENVVESDDENNERNVVVEVGADLTNEEYGERFLRLLDEMTLPTVNSLDPTPECYRLSNEDLQDRLTNDFGWTERDRETYLNFLMRILDISQTDILNA